MSNTGCVPAPCFRSSAAEFVVVCAVESCFSSKGSGDKKKNKTKQKLVRIKIQFNANH